MLRRKRRQRLTPCAALAGTNGLKAIIDSVDNRTDFKTFMQNFIVARSGPSRGPRREGLYEEGYVRPPDHRLWDFPLVVLIEPPLPSKQPPLPPHVQNLQAQGQAGAPNTGAHGGASPSAANVVFGFDLTDAMIRDGDEVPRILEMCAETIEARGASQNFGPVPLYSSSEKLTLALLSPQVSRRWASTAYPV